MSDRDEIVEKLNLYALGVDAQRWELFDQVFTDDVEADFGTSARWTDLASWKRDFAAFHDPYDATMHVMTNHQVRIDGDRANSLTYGQWRLVRLATEGGPLWDGCGWYDDSWIRTADGWKINKRVSRVIWWTGNNAVRGSTTENTEFVDEKTTPRREWAAGGMAFFKAIGGA